MKINAQFSAALIDTEPVQAHDCELCLVSRIELDDSTTGRAVSLQDRVHYLVILGQFLKHESAKVYWQVFDLDQVSWLNFSGSRCTSTLGRDDFLFFFLDFFCFDKFFSFSLLLKKLCLLQFDSSQSFFGFLDSLCLGVILLSPLLSQFSLLRDELLTAFLPLAFMLLMSLTSAIVGHFLNANAPF